MFFRVLRPFDANNYHYVTGDTIELPEGHPRIRAMMEQSYHLTYDERDGVSDARLQDPETAESSPVARDPEELLIRGDEYISTRGGATAKEVRAMVTEYESGIDPEEE